ncbi:hypothetical protein ACHAWF_004134 [Thalassiosira exigua]
MTSVFDRLAHQGTAASDARLADEKACRDQHEQRRAAATAALIPVTNPAKLRLLIPPQDPSGRSTKPKRRTPKEQDAFFNRLALQDTLSSATHHAPDDIASFPCLSKMQHPSSSPTEQGAVFDRLYKQETAASRAHHLPEKSQPLSPKKVNYLPPPSLLKRIGEKPQHAPPIPIKMNLHIRTMEEKKNGKPYAELDLPGSDLRNEQINLFHSGKISAHALAFDVITELFHRDFVPGAHWEIGTAVLGELDPLRGTEGEQIEVFEVEKEAIWDWKDIYSVATAKATIKISTESVEVDEYLYYVAG